jgi:CDP-diacylglycerol--glycerol-3-phosphate 3-phosphatidyltransferase
LLAKRDATDVAAAAVFAVGAWTDLLDGYLARRWEISSRTGAWLDPLADKLLVGAPIVTLTAVGRFPLWAAVVILVREALVTGIRIYLGSRGTGMPASRIAKWKTLVQLTAIFLYILPLPDAWSVPKLTVLTIAAALTVITGADYLVAAFRSTRSATARADQDGRSGG